MSKDKSKKWVISAPLFYNYAGILEFLKSRIPKLNSRIPKTRIPKAKIPPHPQKSRIPKFQNS
ncbi:MAG: hypothetical protein MSA79_05645 [Campylobacter sp.]|nr:hypothetical protein [Campylobacter sp.]